MKLIIGFTFMILGFLASGSINDSVRIRTLFDHSNIQKPENHPSLGEITQLEKRIQGSRFEGLFYYEWSRFLFFQSLPDSAERIASKGLQKIHHLAQVEPDKIKLLNILAAIRSTQLDYEKGVRYYEDALRIAETLNDSIQMAYINNNLANVFFSLQDYPKAYLYSSKAFAFIKKHPDTENYCSILAILALSEVKNNKYRKGLTHAKQAIECSKNGKDILATIISHHAKGQIHLELKQLDSARIHFEESLNWANMARRTEYIILNNIGLLNTNLLFGDNKTAVMYGEKALSLSQNNIDQTTVYSIKKNLAKAHRNLGNHKMAYTFLTEAHELFIEKNNSEKQKAINELLIKYDTEKKEKVIAQNKITLLEKENAFHGILTLSFVLGLGLILVISLLFIIRYINKKRLELLNKEKQELLLSAILEGEENERHRISIELHDGLASILTAARYQLQSNESSLNVKKVDKLLKQAHEDTRRISHNLAPLRLEKLGLYGAIQQLAKDNSTSERSVLVNNLNNGNFISKETAMILYRVAQELIQNSVKHSNATSIIVQLNHTGKDFVLMVEDDGVGFSLDEITPSNGLLSIRNRANQINGNFELNSSVGKGTVAIFSIPI